MVEVLPSAKNPNIDKFAILLRPLHQNPEPWTNAQGNPKMIGLVGTNRMSDHDLETGYCINTKYWGPWICWRSILCFLETLLELTWYAIHQYSAYHLLIWN